MKKFLFGAAALGGAGYYYLYQDELRPQPKLPVKKVIDYNAIRSEISDILEQEGWDGYSHIGPVLVRLAWHASGTYAQIDKSGGACGSTMRFGKELNDPANAGLVHAQKFLESIKKKHQEISYADLWVLASYVAIEEMGGPKIDFTPGRTDAASETACPANGRLPDASQGRKHIRDVFNRMGLNDREIVALIGGGHSIGKCHTDRSGYDGPWTNAPTSFTNLYFKELFDKKWTERKWKGPKQFEDNTKKLMMLPADLEIRDDPEFRKIALEYKANQDLLFKDFAQAYKKLTELGFKQF